MVLACNHHERQLPCFLRIVLNFALVLGSVSVGRRVELRGGGRGSAKRMAQSGSDKFHLMLS